jgi:hypothetical protein
LLEEAVETVFAAALLREAGDHEVHLGITPRRVIIYREGSRLGDQNEGPTSDLGHGLGRLASRGRHAAGLRERG